MLSLAILAGVASAGRADDEGKAIVKKSAESYESGGKAVKAIRFAPAKEGKYPAILVLHGQLALDRCRQLLADPLQGADPVRLPEAGGEVGRQLGRPLLPLQVLPGQLSAVARVIHHMDQIE
jgi:hypothetical protein